MNNLDASRDTRLDLAFSALADPTRRRILARVADTEMRMTDLAAEFPIALNSVSKHVRRLEEAGLLLRTIKGREHRLRASLEGLNEVQTWISQQQAFWASRLRALDEFLQAEATSK
jgi:DNA-binding transcriptional ArsR family regulator